MASSRFGGVSPTQTYQARVKWLVAGLIALIVVLAFAVIYIAQNSSASSSSGGDTSPSVVTSIQDENSDGSVSILVASRRIESGEQLLKNMVDSRRWDSSEIPDDAILASELENVLRMYVGDQIGARVPLLKSDLSQEKPITPIDIPPGFRAVTIEVNKRSGVEGFAKPNSRVDVLWTFVGPDRKRKVKTIVRFVKVLSVGGLLDTEGVTVKIDKKTTVTLLVSERDAKKVELARTNGDLSLSLVGAAEAPNSSNSQFDEEIDLSDLMGVEKAPRINKPSPADGVMYTEDSKTGKLVKYELRQGRWKRAVDQE